MQTALGSAAAIRARDSSSLTSSGWNSSMPSALAASATGGGDSLRPRPRGRSGRVTTSAGRCGERASRSSTVAGELRGAEVDGGHRRRLTVRRGGRATHEQDLEPPRAVDALDAAELDVRGRRRARHERQRAPCCDAPAPAARRPPARARRRRAPPTTQTWRSGTSVSARRPCPGPPSSTSVPVSAIASAQAVSAPSSAVELGRGEAARRATASTPSRQPARRPGPSATPRRAAPWRSQVRAIAAGRSAAVTRCTVRVVVARALGEAVDDRPRRRRRRGGGSRAARRPARPRRSPRERARGPRRARQRPAGPRSSASAAESESVGVRRRRGLSGNGDVEPRLAAPATTPGTSARRPAAGRAREVHAPSGPGRRRMRPPRASGRAAMRPTLLGALVAAPAARRRGRALRIAASSGSSATVALDRLAAQVHEQLRDLDLAPGRPRRRRRTATRRTAASRAFSTPASCGVRIAPIGPGYTEP